MTMHLVGPYMTTTNYKKRKQKNLTDNQRKKLEQEWRAYNKQMRKQNCHSAQFDTFEQYLSYVRGEHKPKQQQTQKRYDPNVDQPYRREVPHIPSLSETGVCGMAPRKEGNKYTGDYIIGIATTHKSNLMPITSKKQAVEASTMRRN